MKDTSPEALVLEAYKSCPHCYRIRLICLDCVEKLIRKERAACARIAEKHSGNGPKYDYAGQIIANEIRTRNKPKGGKR